MFATFYQDTNIFSRYIYTYALGTVQQFRKKSKSTIDMIDIINMNIETDEALIKKENDRFQEYIKFYEQKYA